MTSPVVSVLSTTVGTTDTAFYGSKLFTAVSLIKLVEVFKNDWMVYDGFGVCWLESDLLFKVLVWSDVTVSFSVQLSVSTLTLSTMSSLGLAYSSAWVRNEFTLSSFIFFVFVLEGFRVILLKKVKNTRF